MVFLLLELPVEVAVHRRCRRGYLLYVKGAAAHTWYCRWMLLIDAGPDWLYMLPMCWCWKTLLIMTVTIHHLRPERPHQKNRLGMHKTNSMYLNFNCSVQSLTCFAFSLADRRGSIMKG
jgi:hypothetical protein